MTAAATTTTAAVDGRILDKKHDLTAFAHAIREWLAENSLSPEEVADGEAALGRDTEKYIAFQTRWRKKLASVGLFTPSWPVEYGGAGLSSRHLLIIADEMARVRAPHLALYTISLTHIPATLLAWGSEAQKARYLRATANGMVWCQGFSEPGAGSDLASLKTRAVRDGDHYVINGQKIWSSYSMYAENCILLARTDSKVKKHAGISYFLMNMKSPGVDVRPIKQATGAAKFSELFLTDVRIPAENLVGEENKGWTVAQATLASERGIIAFDKAERLRYGMEAFYRRSVAEGAEWLGDPALRREFMRHISRLQAVRGMIRDLLVVNEEKGMGGPMVAPSVIKVATTVLVQDFAEFQTRIRGIDSQFYDPANPLGEYITSYGSTISAGTTEIQYNVISERGLGMPKG